jgi:peptidylprolyl isomerase
MRRLTAALIALPAASTALAVGVALAGCGSTSSSADANQSVKVVGAVGKAPTVTIPASAASSTLVTKTLTPGHGTALGVTDSYLANFDVYVWHGSTHKLIYSTFTTGGPQLLPVKIGLSGLQKAMTGQRVGGRVLAVLPPKYGYGSAGQPQLGVKPTDTMVWVVDPIQSFTPTTSASGAQVSTGGGALPTVSATPGQAPSLTFPKSSPPTSLVVTTLIKGTGPAVKPGQTLVTRYIGSIWRTGKEFNNDWPTAAQPAAPPTAFPLDHVITAWKTGLVGVPVGSRVMLVVPPAEGYGKAGQPSAGIKGTDTLVFVVDVLAATG